jgi:quercetin dioxygenase-like cupin family protein
MIKTIVLGAAFAIASAGLASAQQPANAIKRTPVQDVDFPSGYHVVEVIAEIPAGTESAGRHTHPGVDASYVLEGEGTLMVEGKPDQELKPGVAIQVPSGVPHDIKVAAGKPLKLLAVYIVEKGKPIASPAPK